MEASGMTKAKLAELERLRKRNGGVLLGEHVVEAARDPNSALHKEFNWDDASEAHKSRLEHARTLIREYEVLYRPVEKEVREVKVNYYVPSPSEPKGYERMEDLVQGPHRQSLLLQEHERCLGHVDRYAGLLEVGRLPAEAGRLQKAMSLVRAALERLA